jgi:hypothetical protein
VSCLSYWTKRGEGRSRRKSFHPIKKIIAAAGFADQQLWLDQNGASPLKGQPPQQQNGDLAWCDFALSASHFFCPWQR